MRTGNKYRNKGDEGYLKNVGFEMSDTENNTITLQNYQSITL
jgi:hypothetical protein